MFFNFNQKISAIANHIRENRPDKEEFAELIKHMDGLLENGIFDPIYSALSMLNSGKSACSTEESLIMCLDQRGLGETTINDLLQVYCLGDLTNGN